MRKVARPRRILNRRERYKQVSEERGYAACFTRHSPVFPPIIVKCQSTLDSREPCSRPAASKW